MKLLKSYPTPSDPMDYSPPGSSIHGIFQARVLEWVAIAFSIYIYIFYTYIGKYMGFPSGSVVKNLPAMQEPQETQVQSLGQEDPLEEGTATHSSILAWKIPWTEKPGGLQSTGSQRVGHDWINLARMRAYNFRGIY